jgi:hypothetical protein
MDLDDIAAKYQVNRGQIQALQNQTASFAYVSWLHVSFPFPSD